jgi:hypothetical protein
MIVIYSLSALDVFEDDPATSVSCHRHHSHKIACFSISYEHFTHGPFDYHFFPWLQGILHKHLLKSMGTPIVDKVLITLVIFILLLMHTYFSARLLFTNILLPYYGFVSIVYAVLAVLLCLLKGFIV